MPKPDHPALLTPGVHVHTLDSLKALAVDPFPTDLRRAQVFRRFGDWVGAIRFFQISGKVWIDGSFLTQKYGPDDVDCVIWYPSMPTQPNASTQALIAPLFDKATVRVQYHIDLYPELPPPDQRVHREAYWKGFFGFCHDGITAKGIAEVLI